MTRMVDCWPIKYIPADETCREFSYQVKKATGGEYITSVFGRDDDAQRAFHANAWQEQKPDILTYDGKPIGTVTTAESEDCIEIGQFLILPDYQNRGTGAYLLKSVLDKADQFGKNIILASLKNNPAESPHATNGFQIGHTSEVAHHMEQKPPGNKKWSRMETCGIVPLRSTIGI